MPGAFSPTSSTVKNPQPTGLFPGLQQQFLQQLSGTGASSGKQLNNLIQTGNPTNVGPAWNALVAAQQPLVQQGQANLTEEFGNTGLRYSTPLMQATGQYQNQTQANFLQILSQYTMQAQEAAANRQLNATEFGQTEFAAPALTEWQNQVPVTGPSPFQDFSGLAQIALSSMTAVAST